MRIKHWPPYPPALEELDHAPRENGWLTEYWQKPGTRCFAAEVGDETIGFSIFSKTGEHEAEFRIASRADRIGLGLGTAITSNVT